MTRRDAHRQRVYDAEEAALGGTALDEELTWDQLVAVVDAVTHHPWWRGLGVPAPAVRAARDGASRSSADGVAIRFARPGLTALTAAHELAHHLVAGLVGPEVDPHGAEFRAAELRTIAVVGGDAARAALAAEWARWRLPPAPWTWAEPPTGPGLALGRAIPL